MESIKSYIKEPSVIMVLTFVLSGLISFLGSPYLMNGFFLTSFWEYVSIGLFFVLLLEMNILGVKRITKLQRILVALFTVIIVFGFFSRNNRLDFLMLFLYFFVGVSTLTWEYFFVTKPKKDMFEQTRVFFILCYLMISLVSRAYAVQSLESDIVFLYYFLTSVVIGLIVMMIMFFRKVKPILVIQTGGAIMLLGTLALFFIVFGLNYSLDTSEPTVYYVEITDKDITSGARQVTRYDVYFEYEDEEYSLDVPKDEYFEYKIGDVFEIKVYEGFLGQSYIVEE